MGFDRSTGPSGHLENGTSQPAQRGQGHDLMSNDGRHKQMLADLADFLGAVAFEDDKGWTEEVYAEGWSAGFRAGLAYAAKIAQSQGRGWGIEHAEQIRKAL
jgi:hypothetical protein